MVKNNPNTIAMKNFLFIFSVFFLISCEKEEPKITTPTNSQINGILYGYYDQGKSICKVDPTNGTITKIIELEHNVDWNLVYDNTSNRIIGSSEQNSSGAMVSLIVIDLDSKTVTYPNFQYSNEVKRITDLVMSNEGDLYGYYDQGKSICKVDPTNGAITKIIELEHNVDWNLVYDNTSNRIIGSSEQNSGGGMVSLIVVDLDSKTVTYPNFQYTNEVKRITDLVYGDEL